MLVSRFL